MDETTETARPEERETPQTPAPQSVLRVAGVPITVGSTDIAVELVQRLIDIAGKATQPVVTSLGAVQEVADYRTRLEATLKLLEFLEPVPSEAPQAPGATRHDGAARKAPRRKKAPQRKKAPHSRG
jgi:hypothetical protein